MKKFLLPVLIIACATIHEWRIDHPSKVPQKDRAFFRWWLLAFALVATINFCKGG